jgi:hypothetical protein
MDLRIHLVEVVERRNHEEAHQSDQEVHHVGE